MKLYNCLNRTNYWSEKASLSCSLLSVPVRYGSVGHTMRWSVHPRTCDTWLLLHDTAFILSIYWFSRWFTHAFSFSVTICSASCAWVVGLGSEQVLSLNGEEQREREGNEVMEDSQDKKMLLYRLIHVTLLGQALKMACVVCWGWGVGAQDEAWERQVDEAKGEASQC